MLDSFALLLWSSLRGKRFRAVSEQTNDERESKTARKSGASKRGGGKKGKKRLQTYPGILKTAHFGSRSIFRAAKTEKSRSSVFLGSETKRKYFLGRLVVIKISIQIRDTKAESNNS